MKHTQNSQSSLENNDFVYTKPGTCITTRWRKSGWIPASEDQAIQAKWAKYRELATRTLADLPTDSLENV
jgi:hypothetical protein